MIGKQLSELDEHMKAFIADKLRFAAPRSTTVGFLFSLDYAKTSINFGCSILP